MTDNAFHLRIQSGPGAGQDYVLSGPSLTIGRYPLADIVIDDPDVSYRHALLTRGDETYRLADLGSDAGTYINGRRIGAEPVALFPGDIVLFGARISAAFLAEMEPAAPIDEPAVEATTAPALPTPIDETEPVAPPAPDEPMDASRPPAPPRLPIHDQPLPEMPPPQKNNNRRIALILAGCLVLLSCCCSATLFMYFIGGDWLLTQLGWLP
jgi:predicted component of type VI protein secretion system